MKPSSKIIPIRHWATPSRKVDYLKLHRFTLSMRNKDWIRKAHATPLRRASCHLLTKTLCHIATQLGLYRQARERSVEIACHRRRTRPRTEPDIRTHRRNERRFSRRRRVSGMLRRSEDQPSHKSSTPKERLFSKIRISRHMMIRIQVHRRNLMTTTMVITATMEPEDGCEICTRGISTNGRRSKIESCGRPCCVRCSQLVSSTCRYPCPSRKNWHDPLIENKEPSHADGCSSQAAALGTGWRRRTRLLSWPNLRSRKRNELQHRIRGFYIPKYLGSRRGQWHQSHKTRLGPRGIIMHPHGLPRRLRY